MGMTPEEMRIAIAEKCPEIIFRKTGSDGWNYKSSVACRVLPCIDGDPLKDLNAMREAEKCLQDATVQAFEAHLNAIISGGCRVCDFSLYSSDKLWHATAEQRAEAFCRVFWPERFTNG